MRNGGSAQREVPVVRCGRRHVETTGRVTPLRSLAAGAAVSIDMSFVGPISDMPDTNKEGLDEPQALFDVAPLRQSSYSLEMSCPV